VQQEGPLQRVTITGNAICDQHAERQHLEGDLIRLWLKEADSPISPIVPVQAVAGVSGSASRAAIREATPQTATAPSDPSDSNERKKKPHKVLVVGHVAARSPEMILRNAKQLTVWFQDVPKLPASRPTSSDPRLPPSSGPGSERDVTQATNVQTERGQNAPSAGPPSGQEPPKVPLEVSAEIVETFVMRNNSGTELDRLFCKDHVEVHQDPKDPKDRALNIHSHELELIHTADGDRLRLKGLAEDLAMVEAQTMTLFGPRVIFDQKDNRAEMENGGKMQLPASSSLNGEQLEKPSDIVVRWNGKMKFNGRSATFDGNVVAEQDGIRVTCPQMHVFLDRQVSFKRLQQNNMTSLGPDKEPKQEDEQPQVKKVICCRSDANTNDPVVITEQVWRDGKLVRHQLIIAPQVVFLNDEGRLHADGPAEVRTLQFGEKMGPEAAGNDKTPKAPVQELQLTRILFQGRMEANNKTRKTTFTGQVRLAHLPAEQIDLRIDEDHLPTSGFTLRCEQLTASFRLEGERKIPTMEARIRSEIQSDEFSGRADEIYYDEGKNQQITFMGLSDNPAELTHSEVRGKEGRQFSGKTIIYWRKTNQIKATDSAGGTIPQ
jgi:lipopolysaccharide export system protein LptA